MSEDTACGELSCVDLALVGEDFDMGFEPGFVYEVHWVEHPDGPIVFTLGTPEDELMWLGLARGILNSIELG